VPKLTETVTNREKRRRKTEPTKKVCLLIQSAPKGLITVTWSH